MTRPRLIIITALLLIAGLTRWWALRLEEKVGAKQLPDARADYRLIDFDLIALDQSGQALFKLRSSLLETAADSGDASVTAPVLDLYSVQSGGWNLVSETANISADGDLILLNGETTMVSHEQPGIHIETRDVMVKPEPRTAQSSSAVVITNPRQQIQGIGFNAWLSEQKFEILSDVDGRFDSSK